MYYDFRKIDGYRCPVKIVISRRGLGKTFGKVKKYVENFVTGKHRFIYVVETDEMVKQLTKNDGEKFWSALLKYYSEQNTSRKRYFYKKITKLELIDYDFDDGNKKSVSERKVNTKIIGGTIKVNGETAGYIVSISSFGELKRNNFVDVKSIFVDEFISEKLDKSTLDNPRKVSSIIQSIGRLQDIEIFLAGNSIRLDDPILSRMGFKLNKYGFHKLYDEFGLFAVLHFVDPLEYPDFDKAHNRSVAGRFSKMIGETNEEENKFQNNVPNSHRLTNYKYKNGGFSYNVVKDGKIVALKELVDGNIACVPFARSYIKNLFCMTEKEQGYYMGYHIICNKALKPIILDMLKANIIYYYSEIEYATLKYILKGD